MILVNGRTTSDIAATDRGLQYGDGLFETVAICGEQMVLCEQHLRRLEEGCNRLGIRMPNRKVLDREIAQICRDVSQGVLKIIITRGSGGRGYQAPSHAQPTRLLSIHPWPDYPVAFAKQGINLRICGMPLGHNSVLAGLKHLNRLEQVIARNEWDDPAIPEGLMLDNQGLVIEGTMSNLFIVREGRLFTPDLSHCGVAGVMRGFILKQAQTLGIKVTVGALTLAAVKRAEELFVCNSLIGLWPVRRLETSQYPLGPITQCLRHFIDTQLSFPCREDEE